MNLYEKYKEMVLLMAPGSSCPSHWGFKEKCLRGDKKRLYRVCKVCWEKAIKEAEKESEEEESK